MKRTFYLSGLPKTISRIAITLKSEGNHIQAMEFLVRLNTFLSKKPELWMFMPCERVGDKWVEVKRVEKPLSPARDHEWNAWTRYEDAKRRCLFTSNIIKSQENRDIVVYGSSDENNVTFPFLYDIIQDSFFSTVTLNDMCDRGFKLTDKAIEELRPISEYGV